MKMTLRALRINKGLSAEEVAKHIGKNRRTYYGYEREGANIPYDAVKKLAELYGCKLDQIEIK